MHCECLVQRRVGDQVQDRAKRLRLHDIPVVLRNRNCRCDEVARAVDTFAAAEHFTTGFPDGRAGGLDSHNGGVVDQRAHQRVLVDRVTNFHLTVGFDQRVLEFFEARLVNKDAARCRAALAGCANRAKDDCRNSEVEVGLFIDDDGIVTTEFE